MTNISHKNLTGNQLHEPKGADTAAVNTVYVADGAGSGTWTASGFTTGDLKPTFKTTADTGWVLCDDGTIGDSSSGASTRANSDTEALFTLLWTNFSDTNAPVVTGRGATAAADYAAHKKITLPKMLGRVFGVAGAGASLTSRALGDTTGAETKTLSQSNLPSVNFTVTIPSGQGSHSHASSTPYASQPTGGDTQTGTCYNYGYLTSTSAATLPSMTGTAASGGSGTALSVVQPSYFINMMIKL